MHKYFTLLMLCVLAISTSAYELSGVVLPEPREVVGEKTAIQLNGAFTFITSVEDIALVDVTSDKFATALGDVSRFDDGVELVIYGDVKGGSLDQSLNTDLNITVPDLPPQGYALRMMEVGKHAVSIAVIGADKRGLFYGAMTVKQMLREDNDKLYLDFFEVNDYPEFLHRHLSDDVSLGNYEQYMRLAEWKVSGLALSLHNNWRDPARRGNIENLFKEVKKAQKTGLMDFMLLAHLYGAPKAQGNFSAASEENIQEIIEFFRFAAESGFTNIWIMADDSTPRKDGGFAAYNAEEDAMFEGSVGRAHGYIAKRVYDALHEEFSQVTFSMCTAAYSLYFHEIATNPKMEQYARDWAEIAPEGVRWVWTGTEVTTYDITHKDADHQRSYLAGHKLFLFDNSNCFTPPLSTWHTAYYPGMAAEDGSLVYLNTRVFTWPEENPFCLAANSYWWNPEAFDVEATNRKAVEVRFGRGTAEPFMELREAFLSVQEVLDSGVDPGDLDDRIARLSAADASAREAGIDTGRIKNVLKGANDFITIKRPKLEVPRAAVRPKLDGELDDSAWATAARIPMTPRSGDSTSIPSEGWITYTEDGVYLAFKMTAPKGGLPEIEKVPHDRPIFSHPDCLDIFIKPSGSTIQFTVDYAGNSYDNVNGNPIMNFDIPRAVKVSEEGWTCEIFLPQVALEPIQGKKPAPGQSWLANFHRNCNKVNEQQSWGLGGGFASEIYFGTLIFK